MTDPHVEALRYNLVPREGTSYREGVAPVERDLGAFRIRLADGLLTVTIRDHYASTAEAEAAVQPYLDAWRVAAALENGRPQFDFEYVDADVVDRDTASGDVIVMSRVAASVAIALPGRPAIEHGSYPELPDDFALDLDTETLWHRWQGYVHGREPLQTMAYFCLTVLTMHGKDSGAAARFSVSTGVLSKLRHLSTETGDPRRTARKATAKLRPITGPERAWLEAAVKALIRRAGEVAAAPEATRPKLTVSDLRRV